MHMLLEIFSQQCPTNYGILYFHFHLGPKCILISLLVSSLVYGLLTCMFFSFKYWQYPDTFVLLISAIISLLSENCFVTWIPQNLLKFDSPEYVLTWWMFHIYLKTVYILLLLVEYLEKCQDKLFDSIVQVSYILAEFLSPCLWIIECGDMKFLTVIGGLSFFLSSIRFCLMYFEALLLGF